MLDSLSFTLPPEQVTRPTLMKMRQRLMSTRAALTVELKAVEQRTRRGHHLRAGTVNRRQWLARGGRGYVTPPYSYTKSRQNPDRELFGRMKEILDALTQIEVTIKEIDCRLPNLASPPPQRKRKPIVPPSPDEF